jgi:hypothetical protein
MKFLLLRIPCFCKIALHGDRIGRIFLTSGVSALYGHYLNSAFKQQEPIRMRSDAFDRIRVVVSVQHTVTIPLTDHADDNCNPTSAQQRVGAPSGARNQGPNLIDR